jgi:hypothetical protein
VRFSAARRTGFGHIEQNTADGSTESAVSIGGTAFHSTIISNNFFDDAARFAFVVETRKFHRIERKSAVSSQVKIVECPRQRSCTTHPPRRTCDARNGDHEVSRFRERDIKRAIRSVENAGKQVTAVEIAADGKIIVIVGTPGGESKQNELDTWMQTHAHDA